ncbi:carboxylesterase family protein [Novosphingobium sediminicola]|uniref:Para-nitrobenzyl esterase n=1 Tax=Novosphingobium sediminicola TaxID=563162 RepID=A0A7W6G7Z3_9SPHN|nr:carboxylesterase family protein [Novosphingobium sediminicola]MBB3956695.1 para-nitrobenzyl esterase [Novosphingobium sediminicola]
MASNKTRWRLAALSAGLLWAAHAQAQEARIGHDGQILISALAAPARLAVSSPQIDAKGALSPDATQYGANRFPGLTWSATPKGTRSIVVVVQGELSNNTSLHLVAYNLPADARSLAPGMNDLPPGAAYGPNVHGASAPYAGPHPHDAAPHAYHLQVFALDIRLPEGGDYAAMKAAMAGHVLASGKAIGQFARPAPTADDGTVHIDSGALKGTTGRDASVAVYKGVPFAAAPVGDLRWRAPALAPAWQGVRDASTFGPLCPQPGPEMARGMAQSEDCLSANIWTTAKPGTDERRPVYVWIYGGGFIGGTGANPEFDGEALAKKGIVVVTFNYRVGALGFLSTPALSRESAQGTSGNYGLLDQIALLRWVQRNITAFGGDPARVTIGGQSAGAGSVGFLTMSPLTKGLFRASIGESHTRHPGDTELRYLSVSYRTRDAAEKAGQAYAEAHGSTDPAALRAMPWQKIIEGSNTVDMEVETGSDGKPPLFRPVVDGYVIPKGYAATYAAGTQNHVTYISGNNKDETGAVPETAFERLRANPPPPRAGMPQTNVTLAAYTASARRKFGAMADEFLRLYPAANDAEAAIQNDAAARDCSRVSTFLWGQLWSKGSPLPVYTYFWTHAQPGPSHDMRGAFHGSEIPYAFNSLDAVNLPWNEQDRKIGETMSSYWANIIAKGDPNGPGLPEWPRYDPTKPRVMELGENFGPIPVAAPDKIAFWQKFFNSQPQW